MNKYIYKWNTSLHIEKPYIQEHNLHMEDIYIHDHIYSGRHLYTQTHLHMEHAIPIHKTHIHIKMHPIFINTHGNYKWGTSRWRNTSLHREFNINTPILYMKHMVTQTLTHGAYTCIHNTPTYSYIWNILPMCTHNIHTNQVQIYTQYT